MSVPPETIFRPRACRAAARALALRTAEGNGLAGDHVHQGAALDAGEDGLVEVELVNSRLVGQNHAAAGAAQGLMGGGGDHVGVGEGGGMHACGNQTGDVGHVHHQDSADLVANFTELGEVDGAAVGGGAGHDQLGVMLQSLVADVLIVDEAVGVDAVGDALEVFAGHIDRAAVGQVTAVGQVHAHKGVAGLQNGKEDSHVGLGAGMGLHVGIVTAEELLGPLDGDVLHHVHALAAAVVTLSGITLGVLVGEHAAHGHHNGLGNDVFGSDELQISSLSGKLSLHGLTEK